MARDYANNSKKRGSKTGKGAAKRKPARNSGGRSRAKAPPPQHDALPGWLWMIIGITAGLVIAVIAYVVFAPNNRSVTDELPPPPAAQSPSNATTTPTPVRPAPAPKLPPKPDSRFTFYELLPNQQLVPRGEHYRPKLIPESEKAAYIIQAGSFASNDDAERRRAEIALLGFEADIAKAELAGDRVTYRVVIGPDKDYDRVRKRMGRLLDNQIEVFFKRVPD